MPDIDPLAKLRMTRPGLIPAATWNALLETIRMGFVSPGVGYQRKITPGGTTLTVTANARTRRTEAGAHPYQAIIKQDYGSTPENPRYVWGVYYDSQILTGPAPMEFIEPGKYKNRLPKDTSGDGSFWFNVISTDALYVEYDCEERTAEIKSWGNGGSADAWNLQRPIKIDLEDDNAP
ncbi:MAG: hypothetical protein LBK76_03430, partial [Verrucomicrobiales bacterium]|nr:hypothetical protein [Verrucomicrobiales bacterium]